MVLTKYRVGSRDIRSLAVAVCVTLAAAMVVDTVWTAVRLHSALPYFDEWYSLDVFRSLLAGGQFWHDLLSQHNEHRIFFPRLILFSDYLFFGGRGWLDTATILAIQVVHATMLILLLDRFRSAPMARMAIASVIVMLLFSLRQEENFDWGFQVQFVGVFAVATLACILFAISRSRARAGRPCLPTLLAAYAAACVATFTMANGILSAVTLVGLGVVSRSSWRVIASALVATIVLLSAYVHGYEVDPTRVPMTESAGHPVLLVSYTSAYLGNFLAPDVRLARDFGAMGLLCAGLAGLRIALGWDTNPVRLALLGILVFTVATAVLTAAGRMDYGLDQAMASRYSAGSGVFWSALVIYWWSVSIGALRGNLIRAAIVPACVVLAFGAIRSQRNMKNGAEDQAFSLEQATDALILGLKDEKSFREINNNDDLIAQFSTFLRDRRISVWGEKDYRLLRQPIASAGRIVGTGACKGDVNAVAGPDLGLNGVRVSGHAWGLHHHRLADRVYIVDAGDRIVGYADREQPHLESSAWHGFALAASRDRLHAYASLLHGELCPIGEADVPSDTSSGAAPT